MNVKVITHDGNEHEVTVENYDAAELNASLNDETLNTVVLGELVISRINVKSVKPIIIPALEDSPAVT